MCELVPTKMRWSRGMDIPPGQEMPYEGGVSAINLDEGWVLQCWHPETEEWSTMLPPVEGMQWQVTPGSKLRVVEAKDAPPPAPSMVEQVEAIR